MDLSDALKVDEKEKIRRQRMRRRGPRGSQPTSLPPRPSRDPPRPPSTPPSTAERIATESRNRSGRSALDEDEEDITMLQDIFEKAWKDELKHPEVTPEPSPSERLMRSRAKGCAKPKRAAVQACDYDDSVADWDEVEDTEMQDKDYAEFDEEKKEDEDEQMQANWKRARHHLASQASNEERTTQETEEEEARRAEVLNTGPIDTDRVAKANGLFAQAVMDTLDEHVREKMYQVMQFEQLYASQRNAVWASQLIPSWETWAAEGRAIEWEQRGNGGLNKEHLKRRREHKESNPWTLLELHCLDFTRQFAFNLYTLFTESELRRMPLGQFTFRAITRFGSPDHLDETVHLPNYTNIFERDAIICQYGVPAGRKAHSGCWERPLQGAELGGRERYPWGKWFMWKGGFQNPDQTDANGWSPLQHAIDVVTFSPLRGHLAAYDLIRDTKDLENRTKGSRPSWNTALHMACLGSDAGFHKKELVQTLLLYQANIEARDPKLNTPLLLAAASGLTDVCEVLIENGCNPSAKNYKRKGAWQLACDSSSDVRALLEYHNFPRTESDLRGRTRTSDSYRRSLRNEMTIKKGSKYSKGGGRNSKGKGEGKGERSAGQALSQHSFAESRWQRTFTRELQDLSHGRNRTTI